MTSVSDVVLNYICPGLGVIMASATFAAPIKSLREAMDKGSLGDLNPTPWAFMTGNCLGWVAYSYLTKDLFVLFANVPGLLFSIWLNMGAAKLQYCDYLSAVTVASSPGTDHPDAEVDGRTDEDGEDIISSASVETGVFWAEDEVRNVPRVPSVTPHEKRVLSITILWIVVLSVVGLTQMTREEREDIVGIVVNINLTFFYGAPLSTIATVVRTRDSATIHVRTMIMTLANTAFWLVYGLARRDPYISIPNGAGFALGFIQALLSVLFPAKGRQRDDLQPINNGSDESEFSGDDAEVV